MKKLGAGLIVGGLLLAATAGRSEAFCGFYVSGADGKLFNNATHVVLMRDGTKTILSMQNNYQGPPQNFAMVVPVPVVLQKDNVKTLSNAVFEHIDTLSAPRLVEYWEEDPCWEEKMQKEQARFGPRPVPKMAPPTRGADKPDLGVKVEAKFTVGEYDIVILSAKDSGGLDTWLRQENYKIPEGAAPYLAPYVQAGSKFFVAKVDATKVKFDKGMAQLSPLRFSYDAETFSLPVRLGLMNSAGTQDLIVNILARGQRYEVANYPNAAIPTNMDVAEAAKGQFGAFYAALFDKTLEKIPKAVVTEYAWTSSTCDPCPSPPLDDSELAVLGNDSLPTQRQDESRVRDPSFVLTRLHARYAKDSLGEDLVFRTAPAIMGGREARDDKGKLETGVTVLAGGQNNFQGRYAVRHPWAGPITCKNPQRGNWGGPPNGREPSPQWTKDIAFAPRGKIQLGTIVRGRIPEPFALPGAVTPLGTPVVQVPQLLATPSDAGVAPPPPIDSGVTDSNAPPPVQPDHHGCGCDVPGGNTAFGGGFAGLGIALAALLRRAAKRRMLEG
jgi:hypothetical protein